MFYCQTIETEIVKLKYYFPPKTITVTRSDVSGSENCQSQNKEVENSHGDGRKSTKKKGTPHGEDGNSTVVSLDQLVIKMTVQELEMINLSRFLLHCFCK